MKNTLLLIAFILLALNVNAQRSPRESYDTYPHFTENRGDFNSYIADHVKKPASITSDVNITVAVTVQIDTSGRATLSDMIPQGPPEVYKAFVATIAEAPKWVPAKLKGKPVGYFFTASYNVTLNKSAGTFSVYVHGRSPEPADNGDKIYNAVEIQPTFPGGEKAFAQFLHDTIKYPLEAISNHVSGRVFMQFVVEPDGSLTDMKILRDPGSGLGEEAIRVMKLSPKWMPGVWKGKTVRVQYTVPINFAR